MNTLHVIERVRSLFSQGVSSDDIPLSSELIYNKLITVRQALLSQKVNKRQKLSDWNYTVLSCVELVKVPSHECSCLGDLGCDVYRTVEPLPKALTDLNRHVIEYVMSVENSIRFEEASRQSIRYNKGNKYTKAKPKYVIENGHMYFPMKDSPGVIKIKFLSEDPIEAAKYPTLCPCTDCKDCKHYADVEFPIDGDLLEILIPMAQAELVDAFKLGSTSKPRSRRRQQDDEEE